MQHWAQNTQDEDKQKYTTQHRTLGSEYTRRRQTKYTTQHRTMGYTRRRQTKIYHTTPSIGLRIHKTKTNKNIQHNTEYWAQNTQDEDKQKYTTQHRTMGYTRRRQTKIYHTTPSIGLRIHKTKTNKNIQHNTEHWAQNTQDEDKQNIKHNTEHWDQNTQDEDKQKYTTQHRILGSEYTRRRQTKIYNTTPET